MHNNFKCFQWRKRTHLYNLNRSEGFFFLMMTFVNPERLQNSQSVIFMFTLFSIAPFPRSNSIVEKKKKLNKTNSFDLNFDSCKMLVFYFVSRNQETQTQTQTMIHILKTEHVHIGVNLPKINQLGDHKQRT